MSKKVTLKPGEKFEVKTDDGIITITNAGKGCTLMAIKLDDVARLNNDFAIHANGDKMSINPRLAGWSVEEAKKAIICILDDLTK